MGRVICEVDLLYLVYKARRLLISVNIYSLIIIHFKRIHGNTIIWQYWMLHCYSLICAIIPKCYIQERSLYTFPVNGFISLCARIGRVMWSFAAAAQ